MVITRKLTAWVASKAFRHIMKSVCGQNDVLVVQIVVIIAKKPPKLMFVKTIATVVKLAAGWAMMVIDRLLLVVVHCACPQSPSEAPVLMI